MFRKARTASSRGQLLAGSRNGFNADCLSLDGRAPEDTGVGLLPMPVDSYGEGFETGTA